MFLRKKVLVAVAMVLASVTFAACTSSQQPAAEDKAPGATTEKSGDTVLTGKLTNRGGKFFLEQIGKQPQEVESYSVTLTDYVDKNVTITGQFSGDTLFAGKIEVQ